jgi:Arc/MetJ-type ribon-helix-helix transcriptional regulator
MDVELKLLADTSLAVDRAEQAVADGAFTSARDAIDEAERGLQELRDRWQRMTPAERNVVGRAAAPVKRRLDAAERRIPTTRALSRAAPEHDPEHDEDPAAAYR